MEKKPKILVLFYSLYTHIFQMAQEVTKGIEVAGGKAVIKQVAEIIPEDKWDDNILGAKEAMKDIPVADPKTDLNDIDGIIVGVSARFGQMSSQMRNFWDQTSDAWMQGTLIGKPAGVFTSTATQHGGQETTITSTQQSLLHHGVVIVGMPYSIKEQMALDEIAGGAPYGASTIVAGDGSRMPSKLEKTMAQEQGKFFTKIAKKLIA